MYTSNMNVKLVSSMLIAVMITTWAGCSKEEKALRGKWEAEGGENAVKDSPFPVRFELREGGTAVIHKDATAWNAQNRAPGGGLLPGVTHSQQGGWSVENGSLVMHVELSPVFVVLGYNYTLSDSTLTLSNMSVTTLKKNGKADVDVGRVTSGKSITYRRVEE